MENTSEQPAAPPTEPANDPIVPDTNGTSNSASDAVNEQPEGQEQDSSQFVALPIQSIPDMMPSQMSMQPISADEIALYDRQIRLWGVKAQEMIRSANILLIGMKALGNEIAKNLVLAGIGSLTILEHEMVTEDDLGSQFLVTEEDVGKSRGEVAAVELRKMNPRVNVLADGDLLTNKMPQYFSMFQVVIATGQPFEMASTINMSCRMFNTKFYAAEVHGMYGYIFADLIMHDFAIERERSNIATKEGFSETPFRIVTSVTTKRENDKTMEVVTKREMYSPLLLANSSPLPEEALKNRRTKAKVTPLISCLRAVFEFQKMTGRFPAHTRHDLEMYAKLAQDRHLELQLPAETLSAQFLRSFMQNLGSEITPTTAFLGGQLAQDVINVLGQREQPLQNFMLFDGDDFKAPIYAMHPIFDPTLVVDQNIPTENGSEPATNGVEPTET